jgi:Methyltransferase domain.
MEFKTFDMERSPATQGFEPSSYDLVIAANVLHATNKLEEMVTNVRQMLRPGGHLMVFEVISNDALRIGLPMGGLPGWWVGADSGRRWGPTLTLPQWDTLLRKYGFSGVETVTPPYHALHPGAVFASQALDDRMTILRSPMGATRHTTWSNAKQLLIIGGKSFQVHQLIEGNFAVPGLGMELN